jgi:hypothetical protein
MLRGGTNQPPDNVSFMGNDHACKFFKQAEQMFLWLTSPVGGKGSYVFNSPLFFNAWSDGSSVRTVAPITRDDARRGQIPLDVKIDIEPGEAGPTTPVLMTQDGRLVYYLVEVNDVYAYFLTGQKTREINPVPTHFPASKPDLEGIKRFASRHNMRFADAETLAVELKSAWVDASNFKKPDLDSYITMEAAIPIYSPSPSHLRRCWFGEMSNEGCSLSWECMWSSAQTDTKKCFGRRSNTSTTLVIQVTNILSKVV